MFHDPSIDVPARSGGPMATRGMPGGVGGRTTADLALIPAGAFPAR